MGLRINSNASTNVALRTLRAADDAQTRSLERLSTGLRINRASDDPSGLVISEQLRGQISGIRQAIENSQNASNLIGTAEAALNEVSDLLVGIRESMLFALNTGGNDADQIDAEQDAVDNALSSIDRIAQTTAFASRKLLDGSSGFSVLNQSGEITGLDLQNVNFDGVSQQTFTVTITSAASQAALFTGGGAYGGTGASASVVRLTGNDGTQDLTIASSFTTAQFDNAVNAYTTDTGVYSSDGSLFSVDFGSAESITVQVVSGTFNAGGGLTSASGVQTDDGVDIGGNINGISLDADGLSARVSSDVITGNIEFDTATAAGSYTFTARDSGLSFQLNQSANSQSRETIGISSVATSFLGSEERTVQGVLASTLTIGGFLSSLRGGRGNDLDTNAQNALRIVDDAIADITDRRSFLGAFQSQTVDTNLNSLQVALQELTKSESTIRDLDFAQESANYAKNQILFQSSISVLAQANQVPQAVLSLLN